MDKLRIGAKSIYYLPVFMMGLSTFSILIARSKLILVGWSISLVIQTYAVLLRRRHEKKERIDEVTRALDREVLITGNAYYTNCSSYTYSVINSTSAMTTISYPPTVTVYPISHPQGSVSLTKEDPQ